MMEQLTVLTKWEDLAEYAYTALKGYPKSEKHALAARDRFLWIPNLDHAYPTTEAHDQDREKEIPHHFPPIPGALRLRRNAQSPGFFLGIHPPLHCVAHHIIRA